jgi:hypothetical protein
VELEVLRAERPSINGVRKDSDSGVTNRAIEAALCLSAGIAEERVGKWFDEKSMNAALSRELRGAGLHSLLYEAIRAAASGGPG